MLSGLDGEHAKLLFLLGGHAQKAAAKKKKTIWGLVKRQHGTPNIERTFQVGNKKHYVPSEMCSQLNSNEPFIKLKQEQLVYQQLTCIYGRHWSVSKFCPSQP